MRLTKDYIVKHIKRSKFYLWSLFLLQNYKRTHIMTYNGDDIVEGDNDETKTEKSANRLYNLLDDFPPEAEFSIDLKRTQKSNDGGIIGPLEFINKKKDDTEKETQQQNFNGFGFVNPPQGWVSESVLNGKLEELKAENTRQINEIMFRQREKDFNEKIQRERQELDELRKELNDEKRKYESNTGAAAETLVFAIKKILAELFPGFAAKVAPTEGPKQLSGVAEAKVEEQQRDDKYKAVEKLAGMLYDNKKVTEAEVEILTKRIEQHLNNISKPKQQADTDGEEDGNNE